MVNPKQDNETNNEFMQRCILSPELHNLSDDDKRAYCTRQLIAQSKDAAYFFKIEKNRHSAFNRWRAPLREALQKQYSQILDRLGTAITVDAISYFEEQPMYDAYDQIYTTEGVRFANNVFDDLKAQGAELVAKNEVLETQVLNYMRDYVENELGTMIQNVNNTSLSIIRKEILRVIDEGLNPREAVTEIDRALAVSNKARAETIARTETIRASNIGSRQGAITSQNVKQKRWISTIDSRTRSFAKGDSFDHIEVDGNETNINKDYIVSGEELLYPCDPKGSAGNTIRCRCTERYLTTTFD